MQPISVLFICVHNSGRSQMAEAYMNLFGQGRFAAESAGFEPRPIEPAVTQALLEDGLDISEHVSKSIFPFFKSGRIFDWVVCVCDVAHEKHCPTYPGLTHRLYYPFPDPAELTGSTAEKLPQVRFIREQIKNKIKELIEDIESGKLSQRID